MPIDDYIDFPVSECWRDHYAAQGLTYPSGRRERVRQPEPRRLAEDDLEKDRRIRELITQLRQHRLEIERLKAASVLSTDARTRFEGIE